MNGVARLRHSWRFSGARLPANHRDCRQRQRCTLNTSAVASKAGSDSQHSYFATCHPGLEKVVANELVNVGALAVAPGKAGVAFKGSWGVGYRANLWLRSAIRVLVLLAEGDLVVDRDNGRRGGDALYDFVRSVSWSAMVPPSATFSVEPRVHSCTDINSVALAWSRIKDAICDDLTDSRGSRPPPPERGTSADVPLYVTLHKDHALIYRDMSGASLHKRGYRSGAIHRASLNESAAAGLLSLAGWPQLCAAQPEGATLVDPMCGSGTLLIEAALMALNVAPGLLRPPTARWPFQAWPDFDAASWSQEVEAARAAEVPSWKGRLLGNDIHSGALSLASQSLKLAGLHQVVELQQGDCTSWQPPVPADLVVTNPPWGQRLLNTPSARDRREQQAAESASSRQGASGGRPGEAWDGLDSDASSSTDDRALREAWQGLSDFLLRSGSPAYVLSGNPRLGQQLQYWLGRRSRACAQLTLGGVPAEVYSYGVRRDDEAAYVAKTAWAGAVRSRGSSSNSRAGRSENRRQGQQQESPRRADLHEDGGQGWSAGPAADAKAAERQKRQGGWG